MTTADKNAKPDGSTKRSLVFIFVLAASFLAWGFLLFHTIGDKGPPPWDFGIVRDIPGESVFSTHPSFSGKAAEPDPQHVAGKPRAAEIEGRKMGDK